MRVPHYHVTASLVTVQQEKRRFWVW